MSSPVFEANAAKRLFGPTRQCSFQKQSPRPALALVRSCSVSSPSRHVAPNGSILPGPGGLSSDQIVWPQSGLSRLDALRACLRSPFPSETRLVARQICRPKPFTLAVFHREAGCFPLGWCDQPAQKALRGFEPVCAFAQPLCRPYRGLLLPQSDSHFCGRGVDRPLPGMQRGSGQALGDRTAFCPANIRSGLAAATFQGEGPYTE